MPKRERYKTKKQAYPARWRCVSGFEQTKPAYMTRTYNAYTHQARMLGIYVYIGMHLIAGGIMSGHKAVVLYLRFCD